MNDYANYADMTGFRSRENYHYKLFSAANLGEYYVAVFNNDVYLQEEATFTITVRMQLPPASPNEIPQWLCPRTATLQRVSAWIPLPRWARLCRGHLPHRHMQV